MIVVDTNIIASLYLANPHPEEVEALYVTDRHWFAPRLWRSEFRNVLALYIRQKILTLNEALTIIAASEEVIGKLEFEPTSTHILSLARTSGCSAYDCEYVALARDLGTLLITFDRKLLASFPDTVLTPTAFLASSG
jgi:predicted nucleic acid-binding protein